MELGLRVVVASETIKALAAEIAAALPTAPSDRTPWMLRDEACDYLRMTHDSLYKLTQSDAIPHRKVQGRLMFHRAELDAWVAEHPLGARWRSLAESHASTYRAPDNESAPAARQRPGAGKGE
jgi:excisionase family DNA binding protein